METVVGQISISFGSNKDLDCIESARKRLREGGCIKIICSGSLGPLCLMAISGPSFISEAIFVQIEEKDLSKLQNIQMEDVFVQITKCVYSQSQNVHICQNVQMYLSKCTKLFVQIL